MFGAGIAYNFTPEFYITGEWLRFTGKFKLEDDKLTLTTAPNIFLLGVGYKFAM
jgi:predicted porin